MAIAKPRPASRASRVTLRPLTKYEALDLVGALMHVIVWKMRHGNQDSSSEMALVHLINNEIWRANKWLGPQSRENTRNATAARPRVVRRLTP